MESFQQLTPLPVDEDPATELMRNQETAHRRLLLPLFVRCLIFRLYIEYAKQTSKKLTDEHKKKWLLLQIASEELVGLDIFEEYMGWFGRASSLYLEQQLREERHKIKTTLKTKISDIFCVLDEAQFPASKLFDYFQSSNDMTTPRPILRELIQAWTSQFPCLIISGTGMSMQEMETIISSAAAKEPNEKFALTDLGTFDNLEHQQAYLKRYLPNDYLCSNEGQLLVNRIGYWLHGRYRLTATYISHLIQRGFQLPHRVLNGSIFAYTKFRPSDYIAEDDPADPKGGCEKVSGPDFSHLKSDTALRRQIAGSIFEYLFHGEPRELGSEDAEKLVEYGIARFGRTGKIVADEPLALIHAAGWSSNNTPWNMYHFLSEALTTQNDSTKGVAYEK
ncbi:hypothetical protein CPB86DRAFT_604772 [Serendipita vermifera]|nr:hypothetical protein CPB86DRAFT_604772 [Serendipita vermifera]